MTEINESDGGLHLFVEKHEQIEKLIDYVYEIKGKTFGGIMFGWVVTVARYILLLVEQLKISNKQVING